MNKTEKLICFVLAALLAGYIFMESGKRKEAAPAVAAASTNEVQAAAQAPAAPVAGDDEVAGRISAFLTGLFENYLVRLNLGPMPQNIQPAIPCMFHVTLLCFNNCCR